MNLIILVPTHHLSDTTSPVNIVGSQMGMRARVVKVDTKYVTQSFEMLPWEGQVSDVIRLMPLSGIDRWLSGMTDRAYSTERRGSDVTLFLACRIHGDATALLLLTLLHDLSIVMPSCFSSPPPPPIFKVGTSSRCTHVFFVYFYVTSLHHTILLVLLSLLSFGVHSLPSAMFSLLLSSLQSFSPHIPIISVSFL